MIRLAALGLGALAVLAAVLDPGTIGDDGFPTTTATLPIGVGMGALLAAAVVAGAGAGRAALGWLLLALVGQAATLQLVEAGPVVSYHHLRPWRVAEEPRLALPLALCVLQALVVLGFGGAACVGLLRTFGRRLGRGRSLVFLALVVFACTKVSYERYPLELACALALRLVQLANLVLLLGACSGGTLDRAALRFDRWFGADDERVEPGTDRFAVVAAAVATVLAVGLAWFSYERHPHVPDEVVYLLHARYLAAGLFDLPLPDVAAAFDIDIMLPIEETGRWYSPVPIGWPLALAVGAFFGAPWLVNPILTGLAVLLAHAFLREVLSKRTARIATVLLCASPWFVFMGTNFMTHQWTLVSALTGALGVARARRLGQEPGRVAASVGWAALAGVGTGMVGLVRPLEGAGLALCLGLWAIGLGGARLRWLATAALVVVTTAVGGLQLAYNQRMTGDATTFPIMLYVDRAYGVGKNSIGFGPEKGLGWPGLDPRPGHDLIDVGLNAHFNTFAIDFELFGWSVGSLVLVFLALTAGRLARTERALALFAAAIVALNSLYWFSGGPDFGARYWYLVLIPCLVLTLAGARRVASWLADAGDPRASARVTLGMLVLSSLAVVTVFPWRAIDKYHHYRGMRPGVRSLAEQHGFGDALVLVRGERHPDAASALTYNPLDLDAPGTLYAWDFDPAERARTIERYAVPRDRPVWIVAGPSVTGDGYEVVAGPLEPAAAITWGRE